MDQIRYWTGAALTAVVAALVGGIGMVIAHGIVKVPVVFDQAGVQTSVSALSYGLIAVAIVLISAAVYDAMLYLAPRPLIFYTWIAGLVTALATLVPFTSGVGHSSQIALAAINLAVGLTAMILVPVSAENARSTR